MKTISIVIPAYNEQKSIAEVVRRTRSVLPTCEIVIVDDASQDATWQIIQEKILSNHRGIKALRHSANTGKGGAIQTALKEISGDIVIIQDADLEYSPEDYPALLDPIFQNRTQVVYGSRFLQSSLCGFMIRWIKKDPGAAPRNPYGCNFLGTLVLNLLVRLFFSVRVTDQTTGYKIFKTPLLKTLGVRSLGFEFCSEVTAKLCREGHAILEVPISYHPRTRREGKKITCLDGLKAAWTLIRCRFDGGSARALTQP